MNEVPVELPKTAIVVFVRNEFPDFCSWLSWYATIGANTIIVYDDHSTDGTWEAVLAASKIMDIRPRQSDLSVNPFTARQRDAYLGAIREFREEFDWIGFVDADEYLYIRNNTSLPALLANHPQAAAIAFSWCIYGSNGHLLKPDATNVEAFTRHSLPSFGHNRSVKSFVRPKHVVDKWRDPHTFELDGGRYVDPCGVPVHWGGPGAIAHDPDWSVAKLMHYIPRSMEHFIERIRRRSDLQGLTNEYWNVFNMNDVEDLTPLQLLPRFHRALFAIEMQLVDAFAAAVGQSVSDLTLPKPQQPGTESVTACLLQTAFGSRLALNNDNELVHVEAERLETLGFVPVYLVTSPGQPGLGHLVTAHSRGPIRIEHDHRRSEVLSFRVVPSDAPDRVALQAIKSRRYLAATPFGDQGVGRTSADRWHANDWELYRPVAIAALGQNFDQVEALRSLSRMPLASDAACALLATDCSNSVRAMAIHILPASEREKLGEIFNQVLPSWI